MAAPSTIATQKEVKSLTLVRVKRNKTMSIEEAQERGMQLWPKWAPVAAVIVMILTPIGGFLGTWYSMGAQVAQLRTDLTNESSTEKTDFNAIVVQLNTINTQRETRHEQYEQSLIDSKQVQSQLLESVRNLSARLDRIESILVRR